MAKGNECKDTYTKSLWREGMRYGGAVAQRTGRLLCAIGAVGVFSVPFLRNVVTTVNESAIDYSTNTTGNYTVAGDVTFSSEACALDNPVSFPVRESGRFSNTTTNSVAGPKFNIPTDMFAVILVVGGATLMSVGWHIKRFGTTLTKKADRENSSTTDNTNYTTLIKDARVCSRVASITSNLADLASVTSASLFGLTRVQYQALHLVPRNYTPSDDRTIVQAIAWNRDYGFANASVDAVAQLNTTTGIVFDFTHIKDGMSSAMQRNSNIALPIAFAAGSLSLVLCYCAEVAQRRKEFYESKASRLKNKGCIQVVVADEKPIPRDSLALSSHSAGIRRIPSATDVTGIELMPNTSHRRSNVTIELLDGTDHERKTTPGERDFTAVVNTSRGAQPSSKHNAGICAV